MTTYLVDYENTSHHGLQGIAKVPPTDTVVIFLGAKNMTAGIPLEIVMTLTSPGPKPRLLWKKAKHTARDYLDIQLASYLGSLIGDDAIEETEYVIVSKDRGFEAAVDFWGERKHDITVLLRSTIAPLAITAPSKPAQLTAGPTANGTASTEATEATPSSPPTEREAEASRTVGEATKKLVRVGVRNLGLKPTNYTAIYAALARATDLQDLHIRLGHSLTEPLRTEVYRAVKELFEELRAGD